MPQAQGPLKGSRGRRLPPLGAHVSVAGGLSTAPARGARVGADVIQIFSKHNTRWEAPALSGDEARAFREAAAREKVAAAAVHAAYLINLGSSKETVRTRSLYALEDEAARAAMLGIPFLVLHPGSSGDDPAETGIARVAAALRAFGRFPSGVTLLLENTAGQGSAIGWALEGIRSLVDAAGAPPDVGLCLDSAHLHAAGYDISSGDGWEAFLDGLGRHGLSPLVRMWHLNDSKTPRGSRVDRHQHIGRGTIGLPAFRRILGHPAFREMPMVIETPKDGEDEFAMDVRNLAALASLRPGGAPRRKSPGKGRTV